MKTFSAISVALLASASFVTAAPHGAVHQHPHPKRAVKMVTVTEEVIETIDVTTTVWVDPTPTTSVVSVTRVSAVTSSVAAAPATSIVESSAPVSSAPASSSTAAVFVQASSSAVPAYTPVSSTVVVASSSAVVSSAAAAVTSASTSSDSSSLPCTESSPCTGEITYYTPALGACGWTNSTSEDVIAMPYGMMGTQSNGNPYCGKWVTIKNGQKTATAQVVDKCMSCTGAHIDLSNNVFDQLADEALGVVDGIEWYFN
ncbi:MAG: hypothetical protein M1834_002082 [Cirrosporium novae-zelandiae]|nr:MAG: hypothetical protein M1834_002082 [Cirrosporium novae-zelandiae]